MCLDWIGVYFPRSQNGECGLVKILLWEPERAAIRFHHTVTRRKFSVIGAKRRDPVA
jgi:hypothetical protein